PVLLRQPTLTRRNRLDARHRAIAREHARAQKAVMRGLGGELEIAVQVTLADAALERLDELIHFEQRDDALDLPARNESQRRRRHDAEESIAADGVTEQLRFARAAAGHHFAIGPHYFERFHVGDERRGREAATVNVRGNRAADREAIRAGLLLPDAPAR